MAISGGAGRVFSALAVFGGAPAEIRERHAGAELALRD
jgi:hypothetical protein